jgi:hypothetical protein
MFHRTMSSCADLAVPPLSLSVVEKDRIRIPPNTMTIIDSVGFRHHAPWQNSGFSVGYASRDCGPYFYTYISRASPRSENTSFTAFNMFPQRNTLYSLLIEIREAFVLDGKGILVNVREREHL